MEISNYICILEVENEIELYQLLQGAQQRNITHSSFKEEDLNNSLTAIALGPGNQSKKLCSSLKLALK